jgi:HAD superfamily hydrolase (TIGR01484 family)
MEARVLVCTDMDRTLLPNGMQPESPQARPRFRKLAGRPEVGIAYVTGRHRKLVQDAIRHYALPVPDYVIGDVGTSLYLIRDGDWHISSAWHAEIGQSWQGLRHDELERLFRDVDGLSLQEEEKQNTYKLSYYTASDIDVQALVDAMERHLCENNIRASLIWSRDEVADTGLLDVLPEHATKLHAVEYLMRSEGYTLENTIFAGDSGNDLPVLSSRIHAVLVANATPQVREQALAAAREMGTHDALYIARGGFMGMNGNYSAGILEGLVHYLPAASNWFD